MSGFRCEGLGHLTVRQYDRVTSKNPIDLQAT